MTKPTPENPNLENESAILGAIANSNGVAREVADEGLMRRLIVEDTDAMPTISELAELDLMERLDKAEAAARRNERPRGFFLSRLIAAFSELAFPMRLAGVAMMLTILGQGAVLIAIQSTNVTGNSEVVSATGPSVEDLPAGSRTAFIKFNPKASQGEVVEILQSLDAAVVGGPTGESAYLVAFGPAKSLGTIEQELAQHSYLVLEVYWRK